MASLLISYSYIALVAALALVFGPAFLKSASSVAVAAAAPTAISAGVGAGVSAVFSPEPFVIDIEHSFGGGIFEKRASFTLSPPIGGLEKSKPFTAVEELSAGLSSNFIMNISQFKELVSLDSLYTIRVRRRSTADVCQGESADKNDKACFANQDTNGFVTTSIPACSLLLSLSGTKDSKNEKFAKEEITIHMDSSESGDKIISIFYGTKPNVLATECSAGNVPKDKLRINTVFKLGDRAASDVLPLDVPGVRPPFLANVRLKSDGVSGDPSSSGAGGEKSQTFLSKYWYIVVILMLYMFRGDAPAPEGAAPGTAKPSEAPK